MTPLVTLVSHTPYPLETMYAYWHASRTDGPTLTAQQIHDACVTSRRDHEKYTRHALVPSTFWVGNAMNPTEPFHEYFDREIMAIAGLDFPLKETIQFSFVFSDVSITWREQAVRQRRATAWSQTSRTRDLAHWFDNGWYEEPASVRNNPVVHEVFQRVALSIQGFYQLALEHGIHREDARALQPTCQTHRIGFSYNARVLEATMSDRLCFIAQADLWTPVISQMRALLMEVDPRLAILFHPPCIQGGKYRYCPVEHENERRMDGRDPMGPCPLWAMHQDIPWRGVPLQANAERQFDKIGELWSETNRDVVSAYITRAHDQALTWAVE